MKNYKYLRRLLFKSVIVLCSVFVFDISYAQSNISDNIQKQFDEYQQNDLQEKLFIHTDRNSYVAGEVLWFKAYCVNAATNQLLDLSKVVYAEVLDKDQQPVLQAKVSLQKGTGAGSFALPSTLPTGNYIFRAYTNWMKNFSPELYFQKTLSIVNTIQIETPVVQKISRRLDAQLFPEGGELVSGLKSKIAFRVTDQVDRGIDFEGAIVNQSNDTVVKFRPLKFGIGSFDFTPAKDNVYKAVIKPAGQDAVIQNIPTIRDNGFVLTVTDIAKEDKLKIAVQTNTQSSSVYLIIHAQQRIDFATTINIRNGTGATEIDLDKLAEGISNLTLFNDSSQPVAERLYFKKVQKRLLVSANADQVQYLTRKKVAIDVVTKNETGKAISADMSMAVYLIDSAVQNVEDINSYLWLSSDLQGRVEHPEYYFYDTTLSAKEGLDNLMLTHGWRRFKWSNVLSGKKPVVRFLPEYEGHIVSGKVIDIASGEGASNIVSYLSVPGTHFQLYTSESNKDGIVYFNTKDFYGSKLVVGQADGNSDSKYRVEFVNPFSESYSSLKIPLFDSSTNTSSSLAEKSISMQVKNIFADDTLFSIPAPIDTTHFFGKPDFSYRLDDFTRFPTMEEVLREYVREINVKKRRDNFDLSMVVKDENGNADIKKPVILLDGVPQFDNGNSITHYSALKVKELEIIHNKHFLGPATFDGIASFTTYNGDLDGFTIDTAATVLDYNALQLKREFYSPLYRTKEEIESRLPDFRNLLYWNPQLKTAEDGKQRVNFYTSDQPGKYAVVLQGISSSGNAGSKVFMIDVKRETKQFANNRK